MKKTLLINISIIVILFSNIFISFNVTACKDIIACGNSTESDYNLLLKVRDPSRPGLQVLCIVPEGYEYQYYHPWTGDKMSFSTQHKYIGVATKGDTIPNIVKAGMSLSEAGLAYGDADTNSRWINPTRYAWDDFDWIRFACEKAKTEEEAVDLLTQKAVKEMHATGVSENLFIVGPNKGYVVEADAFRYDIKKIKNGIAVMSNYPKELWKTQRLNLFPISIRFDTVAEKNVRRFSSVRLGSIFGIRIMEIGSDFISVKPISLIHAKRTNNLGVMTKIKLDERRNVGYFSVELLDINSRVARVRVTNIYKAWEEEMLKHINSKIDGGLTLKDMIYFSRFESEDMNGLRPMCEESFIYEAVAIYKIPKDNYETLSSGWFSANHACSSIYVPFHICNNDIYTPYKTGEAAQISLELYNVYNHELLSKNFNKVEDVFINEIDEIESISLGYISKNADVSNFLTTIDMSIQKQAYMIEEIWMDLSNNPNKEEIISILEKIWEGDFVETLDNMGEAIEEFEELSNSGSTKQKLIEISFEICDLMINAADDLGKDVKYSLEILNDGQDLVLEGSYKDGFQKLQDSYISAENLIKGQPIKIHKETEDADDEENNIFLYFLLVLFIFVIIVVFTRFKIDFE
jgi:hypothetical protein